MDRVLVRRVGFLECCPKSAVNSVFVRTSLVGLAGSGHSLGFAPRSAVRDFAAIRSAEFKVCLLNQPKVF